MGRRFLLLLMVQCALFIVHCQTASYQYGFEEGDAEEANWVLNAGERGEFCNDKWMIGNLEHSEGYQSLYISCDGGATSNYGVEPNVVVAYKMLDLEDGNYDISFDWKVWGRESVSELYVCALPENYMVNGEGLVSNDTIGYFNKRFSRFVQSVTTNGGETQALSGSTVWNNASFVVSVASSRKIQLAFVWVNANQDTLPSPIAAAIDNIQITSAMCPKPENLVSRSECGLLAVEWTGVAPEYECGYKRVGSKYWNNEYNVNGEVEQPGFEWDGVEEGAYDVRIRAIDPENGDTSAYVYLNTVVVWCPDNHCFDFVSLDNKDVVTCEAGAAIQYPLEDTTEYSFAVVPPIDYGGNSIYSRHTTNWVQGEKDPRTGNQLTTIPEGELASVRLGNWNSGAEAERITYSFDVVDDLVLLMKYAVVLEAPGHGEYFDPYFGLEILKEDGTPISTNATCGEAYFSPEKDLDMWNRSGAYVWKNWTTIGVDLRECKGQTVKIQLTTQDCTPGAHGGYAYFTLDCIDATIKSDGCDDITLEAPAGFKYSWYNDLDENYSSTEQKISIKAGDNSEYFCDVTYLDNSDCSFTLSSAVIPHMPMAALECNWEPMNCSNILKFDNKSYVVAKLEDRDSLLEKERCAHYEWEFVFNGEVTKTDLRNPKYVMPNEGGELKVRLTAFLDDEGCFDVLDTTIVVKEIYPHDIKEDVRLCSGDFVMLGNLPIFTSGVYTDTFPNIWGCDSIVTLNVEVRESIDDVEVYDTICSEDPYVNGKYVFYDTGVYEMKLVTNDDLKCDSVVILHLEVMEPIKAMVNDEYRSVCADDSVLIVPFEYPDGLGIRLPFAYSVLFDSLAHSAGFVDEYDKIVDWTKGEYFEIAMPKGCRPNTYSAEIVLIDTVTTCENKVFDVEFNVYYSSSLLAQKFDNMITILDSANNGGYVFDLYRWYKNGELLPDTLTYLYLGDGVVFEPGDCYYLETRRVDDGVVMRSCEICPVVGTDVENLVLDEFEVIPTTVDAGEWIIVRSEELGVRSEGVRIVDLCGRVMDVQYEIESNEVVRVKAPMVVGIYLLQVGEKCEKIVVR